MSTISGTFRMCCVVATVTAALAGGWMPAAYSQAKDCSACPAAMPAIWPDRSAARQGQIRILGWNLAPLTDYQVAVSGPNSVYEVNVVSTDEEGDLLGDNQREDGMDWGSPYTYTVPAGTQGLYDVRIYGPTWSGDPGETPVASTSFWNNEFGL